MNRRVRNMTHGALIAALYVALTYLQNFLLPSSTSMAIQFRASEALCILAFFTPAAIPGLSVGCLIFNISNAAALPLDWLAGTAATAMATAAMWFSRRWTVAKAPLFGLMMPALFNAIFVGWELAVYIGGGFWLNAIYVAIGEAAVLLTLGVFLYFAMKRRNLDVRLFG